mmetsp:Transcript_16487/g.64324  ORF Transcript_16487/g.64324 Transcript_16487/m.64324 type:complete len:222 (+) Transcript_16487:241-906(+)
MHHLHEQVVLYLLWHSRYLLTISLHDFREHLSGSAGQHIQRVTDGFQGPVLEQLLGSIVVAAQQSHCQWRVVAPISLWNISNVKAGEQCLDYATESPPCGVMEGNATRHRLCHPHGIPCSETAPIRLVGSSLMISCQLPVRQPLHNGHRQPLVRRLARQRERRPAIGRHQQEVVVRHVAEQRQQLLLGQPLLEAVDERRPLVVVHPRARLCSECLCQRIHC